MENQFSKLGSINFKEIVLGLLITIGSALLDLLWSGINPIIIHYRDAGALDLSLFSTVVNFGTALDTATVTAIAYFGIIWRTGEKKQN